MEGTWFDDVSTACFAPCSDFAFKFCAASFTVDGEGGDGSFSEPFIEFVGPVFDERGGTRDDTFLNDSLWRSGRLTKQCPE